MTLLKRALAMFGVLRTDRDGAQLNVSDENRIIRDRLRRYAD